MSGVATKGNRTRGKMPDSGDYLSTAAGMCVKFQNVFEVRWDAFSRQKNTNIDVRVMSKTLSLWHVWRSRVT